LRLTLAFLSVEGFREVPGLQWVIAQLVGVVMLGAWFVIFLPVSLVISPKSYLWRWFILIPFGGLVAGLVCFLLVHDAGRDAINKWTSIGAGTGALVGLFASLSLRWWVGRSSDLKLI
jgi:hypothetical protein